MPRLDLRSALWILAGIVVMTSACAPGKAIVRGNWPDGRLGTVTQGSEVYRRPAPLRVETTAEPVEDWLPAQPDDSWMSAADLNRRGVLQPVYFGFDRASIRPDQAAVIEANAAWLMEHPQARILVEGHCDERGTREYNLALGTRRADAARDFLVSLGISPSRIETVSYGEELPAVDGHDERAWAQNRRVEFVIVSTGDR